MKIQKLGLIGLALTGAVAILPLNGQPLLAQAAQKGGQLVQSAIGKPQLKLQLSVDRQIPATAKTASQWQALDAKQAAVVPGNVLRYRLTAKNHGNGSARNLVLTQPIPPRTAFVGNSVTFGDRVSGQVTYSIDQGKTFTAQPMIQVKGKAQAAPASAYTHLRIQLKQAIAPQSTITAQYQVQVQ
ncbi:MAG: hypothetical protein RLZZ511_1754 [Cyanobacteriota bacterium]|jgi:uncharacterized repeat protein (TIGR01451 family)